MDKKFDLDIFTSFAKNFYSDALEWSEIFNILFGTIVTETGVKAQQNIPFSKAKVVSCGQLALENLLKSIYILHHCKSFDSPTIKKVLNDLSNTKKLGHNIKKIYENLPIDWQLLSITDKKTLERYSDKGISIRYTIDAFYKKNISTKLHSGDSYISGKNRENIIKELKLCRSDPDMEEKIQKGATAKKFRDIEELNNMLLKFDSLFSSLKEIYDEKCGIESIVNFSNLNDEDREIVKEFLYGDSNILIPKEKNDIIDKIFNK